MTKKVDETLKKTGLEKKKTSLKITRKNTNVATKKVILETPILDQIHESKPKRTISRKKPEQKENAIGSLVVEKNKPTQEVAAAKKDVNKVSSEKTKSVQPENSPKPKAKKSNTTLTPNVPTPNSKKNSSILKNKQILVKPKRTLRLNIGNKMTEDEEEKINSIIGFNDIPVVEASSLPKKDISINQNSAFFYEPSIFEKFNIQVSNLDEENSGKSLPEAVVPNKDEIKTTEEKPQNSNNEKAETIQIEVPVEKEEDFDFISNDIPEELKDSFKKDLELTAKKQEFIENSSNEYDFISTETPDIYKPYFLQENLENNLEENNEEEIVENIDTENNSESTTEIENIDNITDVENIIDNETISQEATNDNSQESDEPISLDDISIDDLEVMDLLDSNDLILDDDNNENLLLDSELEKNDVVLEAADNVINESEIQEKVTDNAVGKFFDSSIPNMNSETDPSYFTKIKKSLFSNISTVFKKFSYEEASLLNSDMQDFEEASPVIPLGGTTTSNEIKPVLENLENADSSIKDVEVSATTNTLSIPTTTTTTTTIEEQVITSNDITTPEDIQENYSNIIIPPSSNTSSDLEDLNIDDIDLNTLEISDIEDILADEISESEEESNLEENFEEVDHTLEDNEIQEESLVNEEESDELDNLSDEEVDQELNEILGIEQEEPEEDDKFSIEEYFGVTLKQEPEENEEDFIEDYEDYEDKLDISSQETQPNAYQEQIESFSKLIENFTQTISTLSNKISELETNISNNETSHLDDKNIISFETPVEEIEILDNTNTPENTETSSIEDNNLEDETTSDDLLQNIDLNDISIDDISLDDISLEDLAALEENTESEQEEPSLLPTVENDESSSSVEDILLKAFDNPEIDEQMKQDLLSEVLSVEETLSGDSNDSHIESLSETETTSDFFKIIDSLSKTISELENTPDIANQKEEPVIQEEKTEVVKQELTPVIAEHTIDSDEIATVPENTSDKAINILINKDDIFSIAILNETYEIVTDFDGISVISENIHISTPKNNFYVNIGDKYIEIHKQPDLFVVNTNFEDIEFANAINNVTFTKKKNKIELNIKAAFKISSVNKKIELSMLNTSIANLTSAQGNSDSDSSICDNKTLVINEETQKVYLPYTIEDVMKKLNNSSDYQSIDDVIEQEYTLPLSTFKMPIISRFKEAYRFMRTKEKSSVYAALDLAIELMFNSNLNPAVIRASKDLKELNIYLDCLYENELEKFDCFKVIYKVLPKIQ